MARPIHAAQVTVGKETLNEWVIEPLECADSAMGEARQQLVDLADDIGKRLRLIDRALMGGKRHVRDTSVAVELLWPRVGTEGAA